MATIATSHGADLLPKEHGCLLRGVLIGNCSCKAGPVHAGSGPRFRIEASFFWNQQASSVSTEQGERRARSAIAG